MCTMPVALKDLRSKNKEVLPKGNLQSSKLHIIVFYKQGKNMF